MKLISADAKTFEIKDGRQLGYAESGNVDGKALLYFHGHPGSRLEAKFLAGQAGNKAFA